MKAETIKKIKELLEKEVENTKGLMFREIEWGSEDNAKRHMKEYRDVFHALDNFNDWVSEENDDG